jgi:TIGR03009 family protein
MPRLKANLIAPFVILIGTGFTAADDKKRGTEGPAAPRSKANGPAAPRNPVSIERLLNEWESHSARLRTLEFSIYRIDRDQNLNEQHYEGHAAFKHPKLVYLDYRKVKLVPDNDEKTTKMVPKLDASKKRVSTPLETIMWTDEELWQYHYDTKHVSIFRLNGSLPLAALGEAPYPLVFNVKAVEARKRYEMTLQDPNPGEYLLKITPKRDTDRAHFRAAWYILDAQSLLPKRILLLHPDNQHTEDLTLSNFQANQPVNEAFFRGIVPGKPWKVERQSRNPARAIAKGPVPGRPPDGPASRSPKSDADQPR